MKELGSYSLIPIGHWLTLLSGNINNSVFLAWKGMKPKASHGLARVGNVKIRIAAEILGDMESIFFSYHFNFLRVMEFPLNMPFIFTGVPNPLTHSSPAKIISLLRTTILSIWSQGSMDNLSFFLSSLSTSLSPWWCCFSLFFSFCDRNLVFLN